MDSDLIYKGILLSPRDCGLIGSTFNTRLLNEEGSIPSQSINLFIF
jgi:hypothetical protein